MDARYVFKAAPEICAGAEYTIQKIFSIRAGYKYSPDTGNLSGLTGIAAGAGLNLGPVGFDYAFVPFGELGMSHRAALKFDFNSAAPAAASKQEPAIKQNNTVELSKPEEKLYDIFFAAGTLENSGNLAGAEAKYKEILKIDSTYASAWKRLGAVFFKEKKKEQAIKCFETYLELKPDDGAVINWLKKNK
jgi:tetratricopeptide (TPR) repeat protein